MLVIVKETNEHENKYLPCFTESQPQETESNIVDIRFCV
jgi:hypothetical protein